MASIADLYNVVDNDETLSVDLTVDGEEVGVIELYVTGSDAFLTAQSNYHLRVGRLNDRGEDLVTNEVSAFDGEKEPQLTEHWYKVHAFFIAECIKAWSFDDDLTVEDAVNWLIKNPDVLYSLKGALENHVSVRNVKKKS